MYISLLRGINVSGQKSVKMDILKQLYLDLDFKNVRTYIQSGNVCFEAESSEVEVVLAKKISDKIKLVFGFEVPVLVLKAQDWAELIRQNPYLQDSSKVPDYLHLTLLEHEPQPELLTKINTENYLPDCFAKIGKAVYLYCPNGYGRTKLTNSFFENKWKVAATTRNWKTVKKLGEL